MFRTLFLYLIADIHLSTSSHFGYSVDEQKNWRKIQETYEQCAFGAYQTPIHIENHHIQKIFMPALEFIGYYDYLLPPLVLINNAHTVKLAFGDNSGDTLYSRPRISGALLSSNYILVDLHFHWGSESDRGSEHVLYNRRYPLEMHLVHRNVKYNTTEEALKHKDGLAVLAFFYRIRIAANSAYHPIVRNLDKIGGANTSVVLNKAFSLATILPKNLQQFYTYEGSLTTPPCSEAVTWMVFPDTIPLSFDQLDQFRLTGINENHRMLQPVGQRKIFVRSNERFADPDFPRLSGGNISERTFWLN